MSSKKTKRLQKGVQESRENSRWFIKDTKLEQQVKACEKSLASARRSGRHTLVSSLQAKLDRLATGTAQKGIAFGEYEVNRHSHTSNTNAPKQLQTCDDEQKRNKSAPGVRKKKIKTRRSMNRERDAKTTSDVQLATEDSSIHARSALHRDGNHLDPSCLKSFGDFEGRELNCFPEDASDDDFFDFTALKGDAESDHDEGNASISRNDKTAVPQGVPLSTTRRPVQPRFVSLRREKRLRRRMRKERLGEQALEWHPSWVSAQTNPKANGAILSSTGNARVEKPRRLVFESDSNSAD